MMMECGEVMMEEEQRKGAEIPWFGTSELADTYLLKLTNR